MTVAAVVRLNDEAAAFATELHEAGFTILAPMSPSHGLDGYFYAVAADGSAVYVQYNRIDGWVLCYPYKPSREFGNAAGMGGERTVARVQELAIPRMTIGWLRPAPFENWVDRERYVKWFPIAVGVSS